MASQSEQTQESTKQEKKENFECLFKVLVIGELGTGKTSLIKRYVHHIFSDHYRATIGVDFALKIVEYDPSTTVRLQLWDIAGQERFGNMTRVYYKEAVGCIIVYDVNKKNSFEACDRWKEDLDDKVLLPNGERIPCIIVGNKKDKDSEAESFITGDSKTFCKNRGYKGWFEVSAKDDFNVDETFRFLISCILAKNKEMNLGLDNIKETITLANMKKPPKQKCCLAN